MPINKNVFIKNYLSALNNGDAAIFAGARIVCFRVDALIGSNC